PAHGITGPDVDVGVGRIARAARTGNAPAPAALRGQHGRQGAGATALHRTRHVAVFGMDATHTHARGPSMFKAISILALSKLAAERAITSKPTTLKRKDDAGNTETVRLNVVCAVPTAEAVNQAIVDGDGGTYSTACPVEGDETGRKLSNTYTLTGASLSLL